MNVEEYDDFIESKLAEKKSNDNILLRSFYFLVRFSLLIPYCLGLKLAIDDLYNQNDVFLLLHPSLIFVSQIGILFMILIGMRLFLWVFNPDEF